MIVRVLRPNASQRDEEKAGRGEALPFAYFPTAFRNFCMGGAPAPPAPPPRGFLVFPFLRRTDTQRNRTLEGENTGDMASAAVEEDVWNAACVSAGAEEGRLPVAESG